MLEINNVSYILKSNEVEKKILDNINISIKKNEFVAITGPNGSGKSTLAKIIAGIISPTSGEIHFNDEDITNCTITERAKKGISYGFQQPVLFKGITVRELINIAAGEKIKKNEVEEYLFEVGLEGKAYLDRQVDGTLSGGELKRIEIATVFVRKGKVLLFDEPEAGIDLWSFHSLIKAFEKLKEKENCCVIIISHQERIINAADRVIVLSDGKINEKVKNIEKIV